MEIISDDIHRTLAYIDAVTRVGVTLSSEDAEAFAASPLPLRPVVRSYFEDAVSSLASFTHTVRAGETTFAFLKRVRWVVETGSSVTLTATGRAVLQNADRPQLNDPANEPLSVTIDPEDPLAYTRIFHLLSGQGPGMLVDPYLKFEGLADLIAISGVTRILTSNDDSRSRLGIFARALSVSAEPPKLRTTDLSKLHDRFFIPDEGPIYTLGSSLNSITRRPGVVTPIADDAASTAIRKAYAKLWREATQLAAAPAETPPATSG